MKAYTNSDEKMLQRSHLNKQYNGITGVSDFIHRPDFNNYKKKEQTRRFGNWMYFRPQVN
jgi:hypothetical protein